MLKRIAAALWGKFESKEELKKFGFLASIFGLIIGTYWTLRPMKDSIFNAMVGVDYLPYAKMLSLVIIVPLVIIYSKLIDAYPRHKVFYMLIGIYGFCALLFFVAFINPILGLANTNQSTMRILGWLWYVFVESFYLLLSYSHSFKQHRLLAHNLLFFHCCIICFGNKQCDKEPQAY